MSQVPMSPLLGLCVAAHCTQRGTVSRLMVRSQPKRVARHLA
jgi:hypothetical protein